MTPTEITEAYFKARGWTYSLIIYAHNLAIGEDRPSHLWCSPAIKGQTRSSRYKLKGLPNILESFSAFKEHVLEVMGEEGFTVAIMFGDFMWVSKKKDSLEEPIKDNDILTAAVLAATRYFESKEVKK